MRKYFVLAAIYLSCFTFLFADQQNPRQIRVLLNLGEKLLEQKIVFHQQLLSLLGEKKATSWSEKEIISFWQEQQKILFNKSVSAVISSSKIVRSESEGYVVTFLFHSPLPIQYLQMRWGVFPDNSISLILRESRCPPIEKTVTKGEVFQWEYLSIPNSLPAVPVNQKFTFAPLPLSLATLGLLGFFVLWLYLFSSLKARLAGAIAVGILAGGIYPYVNALSWQKMRLTPSERESKYVFTTLWSNVYQAFGYIDPVNTYQALAVSADTDSIEDLYVQISPYYRPSWRDQSFYAAPPELIELNSLKITDQKLQFQARWHLPILFFHPGHQHRTIYEYKGVFVLKAQETWKITELEIIEQREVASDNE